MGKRSAGENLTDQPTASRYMRDPRDIFDAADALKYFDDFLQVSHIVDLNGEVYNADRKSVV
jgi:hypothetical protein